MVTSFEMDQLRWHPVKSKILIYEKDRAALQESYARFIEEREEKKAGKLRKELIALWRGLFRQEKIRREMSSRYEAAEL